MELVGWGKAYTANSQARSVKQILESTCSVCTIVRVVGDGVNVVVYISPPLRSSDAVGALVDPVLGCSSDITRTTYVRLDDLGMEKAVEVTGGTG